MDQFNLNQINRLILSKHHLSNNFKIDDILKISEDLCGLHGTGAVEPYLSLFVRMNNFKKEDLNTELYTKKTLGKIRGMRKTLFIETEELIPIVHNVIKYQTVKRDKKYLEIREISKSEYVELSNKILDLLNEKEMSTSELKKVLSSQKDIVAIISVMCDEMLLIRGKPIKSWKDRRILYAPFKNYFPNINLNKYDQEEANRLLIHRYIKSYGPVTLKDIAWWLGTNNSQVKRVLDKLVEKIDNIKISNLDLEYIMCKEEIKKLLENNSQKQNNINLLPRLDPYLMGYKDRERYVNPEDYENIFDRSGNATLTILLNGKVIGIWDVVDKPNPVLKLFLFEEIYEEIMEKINIEGRRIGKFITNQVPSIKICNEMTPLTKRTMGGFMTPLKDCD